MSDHLLHAFLRRPTLSALGIALACAAVACGPTEPVQPVAFKNRLNMNLSQGWVFQRASDKRAVYTFGGLEGVRLSFEDETRDYGAPMTVQAVRGAIGSEMNLAYGKANARTTLSGTALIDYSRSIKEGREDVYTHNWVVARPIGATAVARVAVTLRVPDADRNTPQIKALLESLDKQLGDAKMPEA